MNALCESCDCVAINGLKCHEHGCPDAWRDETRDCDWCGASFTPATRDHQCCSDECAEAYSS